MVSVSGRIAVALQVKSALLISLLTNTPGKLLETLLKESKRSQVRVNRVKMLTYSQLSFALTDMACMTKEHEGWKREMFQRAKIFLVGQWLEHPQCVY